MSENFTNDAASGSASVPKNGSAGANSMAFATVGVSYDASSQRYTISSSERTQSFSASDRDATQSNSAIDVYIRKSGNTTDSLTLTKPGTSGPLRYRYVGAGFWQRTTESSTAISGSFDAFSYGVETPDAALPRTGQANFTTDLLGVISSPYDLVSFAGDGVLAARFDTGDMTFSGRYATVDPFTGMPNPSTNYDGTAKISGSSNAFTGSLMIFPLTTTVKGRFYGPGAEELGAVLSGSDAGYSITGTLTGRRAGSTGGNDGLLSLAGDQQFDNYTGYLKYPNFEVNALRIVLDSSGKPLSERPVYDARTFDQFVVNRTNGTFRVQNGGNVMADFSSANRVSSESNASFTVYRKAAAGVTEELRVANPGSGNTTIALTYTSFGSWITTTPIGSSGNSSKETAYFVYGMRTDPKIFPTTGSASYQGIISGSGISISGPLNYYDVSGTFGANLNFATRQITGSLSPTVRNITTSQVLAFPSSMALTGQVVPDQNFPASMRTASSEFNLGGFFYGPTASEFGGTLFGQFLNPGDSSESIVVKGIGVARQTP